MPAVGGLKDTHLKHLLDSAISPDIIEERGYHSATSKGQVGELEPRLSPTQRRVPGLVIPAYRADNAAPYAHVLRPDQPRERNGKRIKYEFPASVSPCLDVLPRFHPHLTDPDTPLLITEGAKKADAAASLDRYVAVNLNGVYGWRGRGKAGGVAALADWEHITLAGRHVVLAFDSDSATNEQVRQALNRLAAFLASKGAIMQMINLPMGPDAKKLGLDDWLATLPEGERLHKLEQAIVPFERVRGITKDRIHPKTLEGLYYPAGYSFQGDQLVYTDPRTDAVQVVYSGPLRVTGLGRDVDDDVETATVEFKMRGELRRVTAPRHELAQGRTLIPRLASKGATVHDRNSRLVSTYLTEYASLNDKALPYTPHTKRLGLVDDGLITPTGNIGTNTRHEGKYSLARVGDPDAYPWALSAMLEWESGEGKSPGAAGAWPLWLTLGASLASPFIARLRLRRSPLLYLSGPTGSGKTTASLFATGAWGDPERAPFKIETARTTMAGYEQTLEGLGGLPALIDEAHTHAEPDKLEALVYTFANGQSYTSGTVERVARGGEFLHGTLILAGEAVVEFAHAGSQRRVLYLPAEDHPPLGCPPASREGQRRARVLEEAWKAGPGLLGPRLARRVWSDWQEFSDKVKRLDAHYAGRGDGSPYLGAWGPAVAAIVVTLEALFETLEVDQPAFLQELDERVAAALRDAEARHDPARTAFARVQDLIAFSRLDARDVGRMGKEITCWKNPSTGVWHVPTGTQAFKERLGGTAVKEHGHAWIKAGWIELDKKGRPTQVARPPGGGASTRCLKILALEDEAD